MIPYSVVKEMRQVEGAAFRYRKPLIVFVTIRAPKDLPLNKGKRWLSLKIGHIGQALKPYEEHIGVTSFERGPYLHAHHVLYIDPANYGVIARLADGEIIDVRRGIRVLTLRYICKERQYLGPEIEANLRQHGIGRRKSSGPIPGNRWHLTKAAKALVAPKPTAAATTTAPTASLKAAVLPVKTKVHERVNGALRIIRQSLDRQRAGRLISYEADHPPSERQLQARFLASATGGPDE